MWQKEGTKLPTSKFIKKFTILSFFVICFIVQDVIFSKFSCVFYSPMRGLFYSRKTIGCKFNTGCNLINFTCCINFCCDLLFFLRLFYIYNLIGICQKYQH